MQHDQCSSITQCNPCHLWMKLCQLCNHYLGRCIAKLGRLVAGNPLVTTAFCLSILIILSFGFCKIVTENKTEKLYIPQQSESITNLRKAKDYGFYRPARVSQVILVNHKHGNVLTKECLEDALFLQKLITQIPGYRELCLPILKGHHPVLTDQCATEDPLRFLKYSSEHFENLTEKFSKLQASNPMLFRGIFGDVSRGAAGKIKSAGALRLKYYIKGSNLDGVSEKALEWEKEFLERMKSLDSTKLKCGPISYTSGRSMDDSIIESSRSDMKLIVLTIIVMISFACCTNVKLQKKLTSHCLLAIGGVFSVVIGIVAGFGLAMLLSIPYVSIIGILPFLILGIGIDNMFIIIDELDRTHSDQTVRERVGLVMNKVGPAITMATVTDLLAFVVGTSSQFPSIVYFCTFAALSIAFAFFFLITIFIVFTARDCKSTGAIRREIVAFVQAPSVRDVLQCVKRRNQVLVIEDVRDPSPKMASKLMEFWGKFLMKPLVKCLVVLISIGLLACSLYGACSVSQEFDRRLLAKDGSEFINYLDTAEKYFADDVHVELVLESGLNYSDPLTQEKINNLSLVVAQNSFYRPNVVSWFSVFQKWSLSNEGNISTSQFMPFLKTFLHFHPQFIDDILISEDNSCIKASRLHCFIKETSSGIKRRDSMVTLRRDLAEKTDLPVFASAYVFVLFEQYRLTIPQTVRNLGLAAMAIVVVTSLFLVNPLVVLVVVIGFISLIFELLGLMYIWDVSLNSISMINLVMAIGFAVDYSAHVAHAFVFSRVTNPEEKVIDALRTMGASVFMGGFSTFLGMVVTAFGSSEIFRIFFKMFFGIVVLGLLHGLCFLPVWLSIICRRHDTVTLDNEKRTESTENELV